MLGYLFRVAQFSLGFGNPAAGRTGILHRQKFALADMSGCNVMLSTIVAMELSLHRIAKMPRILSCSSTIFAGMGHGNLLGNQRTLS
jgi:hypothetical protein